MDGGTKRAIDELVKVVDVLVVNFKSHQHDTNGKVEVPPKRGPGRPRKDAENG